VSLDLREADDVRRTLRDLRPEVIYHLAALSSVGRSWEDPAGTVQDNAATAVNVLEAARLEARSARIVWVSSCEVYGTPLRMPIEESAPLAPANPYAVSKTTGDLLAGVYAAAHGLDLVRARPFNHAGPGQLPIFIVSSLARQAAAARRTGASTIRLITGNPDTRRDFTDVRDVVRAYRLLATGDDAGRRREGPGIYNVCSGVSESAAEHVALLGELLAPATVEHVVDPALVRSYEVSELRGANDRLRAATGWQPEIPLRQTISDTLQWWERELASATSDPVPR
jgi:GDP-4-dehydro-6-deoxy-D-mannose reductase